MRPFYQEPWLGDTNGHYCNPMTAEELFRGIDCTKPPATDKLWEICEARLDGRRDKIGRYYFPTVFFATDRRWV